MREPDGLAGETAWIPSPRRRPSARQVTIVLLTLLVAVGTAVAMIEREVPSYAASSRLVVTPLSPDNDSLVGLPLIRDLGDPIRTIETAASVLEDPVIAGEAAKRLGGGWTTNQVQDAVVVAPLAQTNVLDVKATARTPESAARVANAYAAAVLQVRQQRLAAVIGDQIAASSQQLKQPGIASATTSEQLRGHISQLRLLAASGDPTVALAQEALPPKGTAGRPAWMVLAFAGLAGLVLGAGAAVLVGGSASGALTPPSRPEPQLPVVRSTDGRVAHSGR